MFESGALCFDESAGVEVFAFDGLLPGNGPEVAAAVSGGGWAADAVRRSDSAEVEVLSAVTTAVDDSHKERTTVVVTTGTNALVAAVAMGDCANVLVVVAAIGSPSSRCCCGLRLLLRSAEGSSSAEAFACAGRPMSTSTLIECASASLTREVLVAAGAEATSAAAAHAEAAGDGDEQCPVSAGAADPQSAAGAVVAVARRRTILADLLRAVSWETSVETAAANVRSRAESACEQSLDALALEITMRSAERR